MKKGKTLLEDDDDEDNEEGVDESLEEVQKYCNKMLNIYDVFNTYYPLSGSFEATKPELYI